MDGGCPGYSPAPSGRAAVARVRLRTRLPAWSESTISRRCWRSITGLAFSGHLQRKYVIYVALSLDSYIIAS